MSNKKNNGTNNINNTSTTSNIDTLNNETLEESKSIKLTDEEIDWMVQNIDKSEKAKNMFLLSIKGYIYQTINKYCAEYVRDLRDDMFQEAILSCLPAVKFYDRKLGKLTTYFKPYINQGISTVINQNQGISPYYGTKIKEIRRAISYFENKGIYDPDANEIARFTKFPIDTVKKCLDIMNYSNTVHPDAFINEDEEKMSSGWDFMASNMNPNNEYSKDYSNPESLYLDKERTESLYDALNELPNVEKKIMLLRFADDKRMSYANISKIMGIPINIIRQHEARAKTRLLNNPKLNHQSFKKTSVFDKARNNFSIAIIKTNTMNMFMQTLETIDPDEF